MIRRANEQPAAPDQAPAPDQRLLLGAMNHPGHDVLEEIAWIATMGLDFIDLTLEPPDAAAWQVDVEAIADRLRAHDLAVVGHTAYYLPLASPFESLRKAAVAEVARCLDLFARLGVQWMNVHPDGAAPMHTRAFVIEQNLRSLQELLALAQERGVGLMLENMPGQFNTPDDLAPFFEAVPELGLHLDIGHANLQVAQNTTEAMIQRYAHRLRHVHLHDNRGGFADLHLPLGTGSVDYARHLGSLKAAGYGGTITLEVFTPDRQHLRYSSELVRTCWEELPQYAAQERRRPD